MLRATRAVGVLAPGRTTRRGAGGQNMQYVTEYLPENHLTEYVLTPKSFFRLR